MTQDYVEWWELDWKQRHMEELDRQPLGRMITGWVEYADLYQEKFDSDGMSKDSFLGPEWEKIGQAIIQLLNGDLGQMDGGLLSRYILDALERNGYDEEGTSE
jgi:hypothetical protein